MSLVGPWLSTTSTKKRKIKVTKSGQEELERGWRERNIRLKQIGLPKETLEQYTDWLYGKSKKSTTKERSGAKSPTTITTTTQASSITKEHDYKSTIRTMETNVQKDNTDNKSETPDSELEARIPKHWVTGACATKPSPTYTGSKMIGISQLHKSNAVPVFTDEEIKDIARMRR
jgi:hypothetical protein